MRKPKPRPEAPTSSPQARNCSSAAVRTIPTRSRWWTWWAAGVPCSTHIGSLRSGDAVRLRTPYEWDGENGWTASFPDIEACLFESDAEAREKAVYVAQAHLGGICSRPRGKARVGLPTP